MQRRTVVLGALALAGVSNLPRPGVAQQKLVLKTSDVHPVGYPTVVAVENLGRSSNRRPVGG
jgi:hypothetical protein